MFEVVGHIAAVIAEMLKGKILFAISLLGATIQDGGMKERSEKRWTSTSHQPDISYFILK